MTTRDECDVCHEPGSEREDYLLVAVGTVPDSPSPDPKVVHVHTHCLQHVETREVRTASLPADRWSRNR